MGKSLTVADDMPILSQAPPVSAEGDSYEDCYVCPPPLTYYRTSVRTVNSAEPLKGYNFIGFVGF